MAAKKQKKSRTFKRQMTVQPASIHTLSETILSELIRIGLNAKREDERHPIEIVLKEAFVIAEITSGTEQVSVSIGTPVTGRTTFVFTEDGNCVRDHITAQNTTWISGLRAMTMTLDRLLRNIEESASSARQRAQRDPRRMRKAA